MKLTKFSKECISRYKAYINDIDKELAMLIKKETELLEMRSDFENRINDIKNTEVC